MNYQIVKANQFLSSPWSGGNTIELLIYPKNAKYEVRNFDFRISTATVNVEESTFTPLPSITRTLMVLDGQMTLNHKGHHSKKLGQFDSDYFDGGWKTTSLGKCTDFNLMTMGKTDGTVESLLVLQDQQVEFSFSENIEHLIFYIYSGEIRIGNEIIKTGDILHVENPTESFEIHGIEKCDLIITKIL